MRVGVYIDGFNLYHGGCDLCGRHAAGWRWLDLLSLAGDLVGRQPGWRSAVIDRLVYCTTRVSGATDTKGQQHQYAYLQALALTTPGLHVEYGYFMQSLKRAPLAEGDPASGRPALVQSRWPVMIQDSTGADVRAARFIVQYLRREEKGSDVNLATHLLLDTLKGRVDAAVIVSNDSDLRLPIQEAKERLPVGVVNPGQRLMAGALRLPGEFGVGGHWQLALVKDDFRRHQLPSRCGKYTKPPGW
jgi:uncharacterized LabA/DUF88 family protein